jgi:MFS family permease
MRSLVHHHSTWHARLNHSFWLLEISVLLYMLAYSIVNIYIPVILYEQGYSIQAIIWFYVLYNLFDVPFNFVVDAFIRKFGAKIAMIFSVLTKIVFLIILTAHLFAGPMQLFVLAILSAMYDCFFWITHLYLFAETGEKHSPMGKETGIIYAVRQVAGIVGPAIGGALLVFHYNGILTGTCIVILAISLVPLFFISGVQDKPVRKRMIWPLEFLRDPVNRRNAVDLFLYGFHDIADSVLWPLFILIVLGSLSSVAILAVLASWSTVIFSYFTGSASNRYETLPMVAGSIIVMLLWIGRVALSAPSFYYGSLVVMGFAAVMVMIPVDRRIASHGKSTDVLAAYTYRNAAAMLAEFIGFLALAFLVNVFQVGFVLAAAAMFVFAFVAGIAGMRRYT